MAECTSTTARTGVRRWAEKHSVRRGGAAEGRHGRERLPDGVLDRALLLLPLGHADLSRCRPAAHRVLCRLPTPVPTSFCYCNQRSALHSQEFPSVRPSALSGWGVHSFILVKEKKNPFLTFLRLLL